MAPDEVHRVANERLMQMMPQVLPPAGEMGPPAPDMMQPAQQMGPPQPANSSRSQGNSANTRGGQP